MRIPYSLLCLLPCISATFLDEIPKKDRKSPRWEPLWRCESCIPWKKVVAPGVGIQLSMGYGVAAVKFDNGSIVDVAKISAKPEYITLMKRKSREDPLTASSTRWEQLREIQYQYKRWFNKLIGRPGSIEATIIADLLRPLLTEVESKLGERPNAVALTVPYIPVDIIRYIKDAAEILNIEILSGWLAPDVLQEFSSTFAAAGFGLCDNYRDFHECETDEAYLPLINVLGVSLSNASLSVQCAEYREAKWGHGSTVQLASLGYAERWSEENEKRYWEKVTNAIVKTAKSQLRRRWRPEVLLLTGDAVEVELDGLKGAIRGAFETLFPGEKDYNPRKFLQIKTVQQDCIFSPARGAAEFARRFQGSPQGCWESLECGADWVEPAKSLEVKRILVISAVAVGAFGLLVFWSRPRRSGPISI